MRNVILGCCMIWGLMTISTLAREADSKPVIYVNERAEYSDEDAVPERVRKECTTLNTALVTYFKKHVEEMGYEVKFGDHDTESLQDRFLKLSITDLRSDRSVIDGHDKHVWILVELYENGRLLESRALLRFSSGGLFSNFKSSCSVLHSCARALGRDAGNWMHEVNAVEVLEQTPPDSSPASTVEPPPPSEVPALIRKLGELRDEGLLTEEEFQAKKIELLKRI